MKFGINLASNSQAVEFAKKFVNLTACVFYIQQQNSIKLIRNNGYNYLAFKRGKMR